MATSLKRSDYSVGWICAIAIELAAVRVILDETHPQLAVPEGDTNSYTFGRIGGHNVVIACLRSYGTAEAGIVAAKMSSAFTRLRFGLMVGVGGGAPSQENDIRLGDIVVSQPTGVSGGVIQYDFGKAMENGEFERTGFLNAPPSILLSAVASVKALDQVNLGKTISDAAQEVEEEDTRFLYPGQDTDRLFRADYHHVVSEGRQRETCKSCKSSGLISRSERPYDHPYIHYGIIASGNEVMKDGIKRNQISAQTGALCFEMEAAGLMNNFPCLVIRGICDYCDGHKNKRWQPYAALVAAIYTKELLLQIPITSKHETDIAKREVIEQLNLVIPFRIPFPRNPKFVGRAEEHRQIYSYFSDSKSDRTAAPRTYAITGTGGMGKTQVALEYAYRHHKDYTAVFWITAASEDTLRASFIDIIQRIVTEQARFTWPESVPDYEAIGFKLGIPGLIDTNGKISAKPETTNGVASTESETINGIVSTQPETNKIIVSAKSGYNIDNIRSALFRWLQLSGNDKWLLIFDNADDLETLDLQAYLPSHGGGNVMITSRRPEFQLAAEQTVLEGLDQDNAVKLILSLAPSLDAGRVAHNPLNTWRQLLTLCCHSKVDRNEVITLVQKLGFMPLAISHAGCYIHQTKASPRDYMLEYEKAFMSVQKKPKIGWNYRDDTAATTWEISFAQIEKKDEEAASLLLTCSYLNPAEIFESMWESEGSGKAEVKDRVLLLASYSLVSVIFFGGFSIHPVVHSWARERLDQSERFQALEDAIMILGNACQLPTMSRESDRWDPQEERRILSHLGYLHRYSKQNFSKFFIQHEEKPEQQTLLDLLDPLHNIAGVFFKQGMYDEAMQWYARALAGSEQALGAHHSSTLITVNNIGGVFVKQGKHDEAMHWYQRALAGKEALNKNHPDTLATVNNIAGLLSDQGKYDEALHWYERVLVGYETLGEDNLSIETVDQGHPSILRAFNNIGGVLVKQGKYQKAMQWYQRALAGREKFLGKDHPDTLITVHNIAGVFFRQGKYYDALRWYERALDGRQKALGKDHLDTLTTINNMASVFSGQGKYDDAIEWYEQALTGREKLLDKDHPTILTTISSIAGVFFKQGAHENALHYYKRVLISRETVHGKNHPSTLTTVHNIALIFSNQGKYEDAIEWYERALVGRESTLGKDHPSVFTTIDSIAGVFFRQGDYRNAIEWYERALAGKEKTLGEEHPSTISTANNIAFVLEHMNNE